MSGIVRSDDYQVPKYVRDTHTMRKMGVSNDEFDALSILELFKPPSKYDTCWFLYEDEMETDLDSLVSIESLRDLSLALTFFVVIGFLTSVVCLALGIVWFLWSLGTFSAVSLALYLAGVRMVRRKYVTACTNAFLMGYLSVYANIYNIKTGHTSTTESFYGNSKELYGYDVALKASQKTSDEGYKYKTVRTLFKADPRFRTLVEYGVYTATSFRDAEDWLNICNECFDIAFHGNIVREEKRREYNKISIMLSIIGRRMVDICNSIIKNDFRLSIKKYYETCVYFGWVPKAKEDAELETAHLVPTKNRAPSCACANNCSSQCASSLEARASVVGTCSNNCTAECASTCSGKASASAVGFVLTGGKGNKLLNSSYPHNRMSSNVVIERPEPKKPISLKKPEIKEYIDPISGEVYKYRTDEELTSIKLRLNQ